MRRFTKKRKQITKSTKVTYKGYKFASKLELYMYRALEKEKIKVVSMRAKTNRIEHQFMSLINGDQL